MASFDWKTIAGPLAKVGAGTLGTLIGGPAGGAIGSAVGGVLAEALGVPATPEAVGGAIAADPDAAREALASRDAEISKAIAEAELSMIREVNETYRLELKSESWFIKGWRPACGWMLCVVWGVHGLAIGLALVRKDFEVIRTIESLTIFYATMTVVTGVAAWGRTKEKVQGVAGASVGGLLGGLINKAVKK
jgi:outer membrane lipoprotein SlyB